MIPCFLHLRFERVGDARGFRHRPPPSCCCRLCRHRSSCRVKNVVLSCRPVRSSVVALPPSPHVGMLPFCRCMLFPCPRLIRPTLFCFRFHVRRLCLLHCFDASRYTACLIPLCSLIVAGLCPSIVSFCVPGLRRRQSAGDLRCTASCLVHRPRHRCVPRSACCRGCFVPLPMPC